MNRVNLCSFLLMSSSVTGLIGCDSRSSPPESRTTDAVPERSQAAIPADNTANNRGDGQRGAKTPMDQSQSSEHVQITADIRRAVVADESISAGAKNCKIITDKSGTVWLRGPVDNQAEKELIERIARQNVGVNAVMNELEVKAD